MKEKWQSIRGFFRKNGRKQIPLLLLAAILLPIVVDNSYMLGIKNKRRMLITPYCFAMLFCVAPISEYFFSMEH